jgi:ATP adenylyltransferase
VLERLWAGWRNQYVRSLDGDLAGEADAAPAEVPREPGQTLFESILASEGRDAELGIIHRGEHVFVILNIHPYGSGHLLVLPNRGVERLSELSLDESRALWDTVDHAVAVCEAEYRCPGINVGLNQGKAAGAGIPEHLHVHVLPRWDGDTNFMTALAETRVLPESLADTYARVSARWHQVPGRT